MKTIHIQSGALRVTILTAAIATMLALGACGGSGSTSKQLGSAGSAAIPTSGGGTSSSGSGSGGTTAGGGTGSGGMGSS
jgi:hypothetical protein